MTIVFPFGEVSILACCELKEVMFIAVKDSRRQLKGQRFLTGSTLVLLRGHKQADEVPGRTKWVWYFAI